MEQLSDGGLKLSTKHASHQKYVHSHIIVTTNQDPAIVIEMLPNRVLPVHTPPLEWDEVSAQAPMGKYIAKKTRLADGSPLSR